jgi:rod shape-determining protein MreC
MALSFKVKAISRSNFLKNLSLSIIFLLSFLLILFSKSDYFLVNKFKTISNNYIHPITTFVVAPINIISGVKTQFYEFKNLKTENNILKEEIMRLKKWQTLAIQNSSENRVFKKLLNATDNNLALVKTASLITKSAFMFSKMININAGFKDGVSNNMAVVNHRGLIGRTLDTSINYSRVLLLTDHNSSVSVKTISKQNYSLLQGADDGVHLVSIFNKDDQIPSVGDLVVTSGSAQIFPSDILVGKIVKTTKNKFYVLPFVDFKKINYVQVVENR